MVYIKHHRRKMSCRQWYR